MLLFLEVEDFSLSQNFNFGICATSSRLNIMNRILYLLAAILIFTPAHSQTRDKKAKEFYDNGLNEVAKKNYSGAITSFTEAIKRDSNFIQAYENRGVARFYLYDNSGAKADYTRALKINPNDYNTLGRRGWAEFHLQEYMEAIDDFTRAIKGNPDKISYYNIRGQAKYQLRDFSGAVSDFNAVIKAWSGERDQKSKAWYWRGMAEIELGQKENGCLDLKKAQKSGYADAFDSIQKFCK
jgi:tetratricopeptide (TPR) repeat protein